MRLAGSAVFEGHIDGTFAVVLVFVFLVFLVVVSSFLHVGAAFGFFVALIVAFDTAAAAPVVSARTAVAAA